MVQFEINHKITSKDSTNVIYSGQHWTKRKETADYWHTLVYSEMRRQKIPKRIFEKPVIIEIAYNSRLDLDNHGFIQKMVIDGMKGYLIHNDTRKCVVGLIQRFKSKGDSITVRVGEIDE